MLHACERAPCRCIAHQAAAGGPMACPGGPHPTGQLAGQPGAGEPTALGSSWHRVGTGGRTGAGTGRAPRQAATCLDHTADEEVLGAGEVGLEGVVVLVDGGDLELGVDLHCRGGAGQEAGEWGAVGWQQRPCARAAGCQVAAVQLLRAGGRHARYEVPRRMHRTHAAGKHSSRLACSWKPSTSTSSKRSSPLASLPVGRAFCRAGSSRGGAGV